MSEFNCVASDVKLGAGVRLARFINLYGCEIGDGTKIGAFVEIQKNARIGQRCKISSHSFICEGVTIEDNVFVGHGVVFTNDLYPRATAGFIGGPVGQGFEEDFATFCGVKHCVGVGSGTDALRFAFLASGIGPGDIVMTVPNTFIATTEAISQAGARPVFVDIDERTYNMDPQRLEEYLERDCYLQNETRYIIDRRDRKSVV